MNNGDEKVLSQADVDALVALVPDAPRAASVAAAPEPAPAPTPEPPPPPVVTINRPAPVEKPVVHAAAPEPGRVNTAAPHGSSVSAVSLGEMLMLKKQVEDLNRQISKLSSNTQRLDDLEEKISQLSTTVQKTSRNPPPSTEKIAVIESRMDDLIQQVYQQQDQLAHRRELRDDFVCEKCENKGTMAILTKCTSCGQERWFGWWPRKKSINGNGHDHGNGNGNGNGKNY
jgi:uncharacterized phage infection (PIP) family protein YhgE